MTIPQISVTELVNYLTPELDLAVQLVDVREPEELAIAQIDGFINLPLNQFADWGSQIYF
jgi:rhodanese-related sulfurtransferase